MTEQHPSYPNPTIQEALCEIHYRLPEQATWNPALFGEFYKHVATEFPTLEPASQIGIRLQLGPALVDQTFLPPQHRMRYKHAKRNMLLQLSEGIVTINELRPYPGWAQTETDILNAWKAVQEVVGPSGILRIGLRYINRIVRVLPDERPESWLAPSDYIPRAVLQSLPGFFLRLQTAIDHNNRRIVTLGEASDDEQCAISLDIDCIIEREMSAQSDIVRMEVARLHDSVWQVFAASRTPRLERLLEGEQV